MRRACILVVLLVAGFAGFAGIAATAGTAAAQPVSYRLKGDVPLGKKPQLEVSAVQAVTDLRIELDRDDGKHFTMRRPALAKGRAVVLPIGDGAAGKAAYKGTISANVAGQGRWSGELTFETLVRASVHVTYDAAHLDLDHHVLQFQLSRPAGSATITAIGEDGQELGQGSATYDHTRPGTWLSISWTQPPNTRVMMLKLRTVTAGGLPTDVQLIPWSVTIAHEDVNFATDSAVIEPGEQAKLDASLAKIDDIVKRAGKFMKLRLYIAGHTDTVGGRAKNRRLSLARARAIASYFRHKGLTLPIAYAGFGEEVLEVKTPDNTDKRANRRADYVLGPDGAPPPFGGAYRKVRAAWQQLR